MKIIFVAVCYFLVGAALAALLAFTIGKKSVDCRHHNVSMKAEIAYKCMNVCKVEAFHINQDWISCQCAGKEYNIGHPNR